MKTNNTILMSTQKQTLFKEKSLNISTLASAKRSNNLSTQKKQKAQISPFKVGDVLKVKINALNLMQDNDGLFANLSFDDKLKRQKQGTIVGISQLANGYTIFVPIVSENNSIPKISLGDDVSVSLETVCSSKLKYATAKVLKIENKAQSLSNIPVQVGDIMDVTISKPGPKNSGLVQLLEKYTVVVPNTKVGDQVKIQISRVKQEYAFGFCVNSENVTAPKSDELSQALMENTKFHLVLPKNAKIYRGYAIVKLPFAALQSKNQNGLYSLKNSLSSNDKPQLESLFASAAAKKQQAKAGFVVFIKLGLGAKLGDTVRIQTMKVGTNYAVAKVLKVSPLSKTQKLAITKKQVQQMIQKGMHFGEKAINCHANMRSYLWYRKKGQNKNMPLLKKDRYYLNVLKTRRCLKKALKQLAKYASKGKTFLFVGTKKSASALIARTALFTKTSFFVNTRWLGGMLTNWKTIKRSMARIRPILKEKQKVIESILEKRQKIKYIFIQKVNLLRKRGQKLMLKGKNLIAKLKQNKNLLIERSQKLMQKKQEILAKNQVFIQKYIDLKMKKTEHIQKSQILLQKGNMLVYQKQNLLKQFKNNQARLKEFKQLFLIGQELLKLKNNATQKGQQILSVSYGTLVSFAEQNNNANSLSYTVPNPSKEILNRITQTMKMKSETSFFAPSILPKQTDNSLTKNQNHAKATGTKDTLVLSKLLNKFTSVLPFMKVYVENLLLRHQNLVMLLENNQKNLDFIQAQLETNKQFYRKVCTQLLKVKTKLLSQQKTLKTLRTKLRRLAAEQRLLKFLPKLRYLPTPKAKMAQTIQILMKKFVDPKLTVPMEQIYDDRFKFTSKKIAAARKQQWQRLEKYFGGITKMAKMKKKQISNNVAIIVGQQEEMNAVRECQKLGIKMFTLVDTNCNPKLSDHVIPVNDDSRNSVKFVLEAMLTHIRLAQKLRQKVYLHKTKKKFS